MRREIDWSKIPNFKVGEFPDNVEKYTDPQFLYNVQSFRNLRTSKQRMFPSPVIGAFVRLNGSKSSMHYADLKKEKKSKAGDFFCEGIPIEIYSQLLTSRLFSGIGIYLDTRYGDPWVMFHLDNRAIGYNKNTTLIWICKKEWDDFKRKLVNVYYYPQYESKYWYLLGHANMSLNYEKGNN